MCCTFFLILIFGFVIVSGLLENSDEDSCLIKLLMEIDFKKQEIKGGENRCTGKDLSRLSVDNAKKLYPPNLHCVGNTSVSFTYNQANNYSLIYFLEYDHNKNFTSSLLSSLTFSEIITLTNISTNTDYWVRLWGMSQSNMIYRSDFMRIFIKMPVQIEAVTDIRLENLTVTLNKTFSASIGWNPGKDLSCQYTVLSYLKGETSHKISKLDMTKNSKFQYTMNDIKIGNKNKVYTITVTAKNGDQQISKTGIITVPACVDFYKNVSYYCSPLRPILQGLEKHNCYSPKLNVTICDIKLKWISPKYIPDNYTAILDIQSRGQKVPIRYFKNNISGGAQTTTFKGVRIEEDCRVILTAVAGGGSSSRIYVAKTKLIKDLTEYSLFTHYLFWAIISAVIGFLALTILSAIITIMYLILNKQKILTEENILDSFWSRIIFKNETLNQYYFSTYAMTENQDPKWEVDEKNLLRENIIGVGAFGVIQKGLFTSNLNEKTIVAVKMLKAKPSLEQIRQFYDEIELMKTVPKHPHVVHLIGVITKSRQSNPLMLTEYCAKGDLHTFLKKVWIALGNRDSNINSAGSNDTSFCKDFNNDFYEVDVKIPDPEYILESKDLLSFARQIAIGMEFLSSHKIIHRDLAARNILITQDNAVKISDFGLSKDVYTNNMYKKTTCGKLPFRWMALESLTHQIYTTESDVWSFGIVLWEVVTLGGYPYPTVDSLDLIAHLKEEKRMERPINCSKELYLIMLQCWHSSPKQRPSFTDLRNTFEKLLETEGEYVNLDDIQKLNSNYYYQNIND